MSNLFPTWEELKSARLVFKSSTRNEEVISRQNILQIVNILSTDYREEYVFIGNSSQQEFTQEEYYRCVEYKGLHFLSLITYEQQAREAEIRARILLKVKRQSSI